ncbi:MAG: ABC transporter permease [Anaerovoracaceae bacterium]
MLIWENFLLALTGIRSNKMRALLTMLGIIIGISSVISIISIGNAMSKNLENSMQSIGLQNLSLRVAPRDENDYDSGIEPKEFDLFTAEQLDSFEEKFQGKIAHLGVTKDTTSESVRVGRTEKKLKVSGTNEGQKEIAKIKITKGRYFYKQDVKRAANVMVIPSSIAEDIAPGQDVLGKELKLNIESQFRAFTIIGVYDDSKKTGADMFGGQENTTVYIPVTVVGDLTNSKAYSSFSIMPAPQMVKETLTEEINTYMEGIYRHNQKWHVEVYDEQKGVESMTKSMGSVKIAIAVIAGISLLVGGIGVMNIMLVSVTERTREIGVRKALGAKAGSIRKQFVIEAMIICGIGGIIGVTLGLGISMIVTMIMKLPPAVSIISVVISVIFSMAIGIFFGYYPANKAAKLDPIEALRYE